MEYFIYCRDKPGSAALRERLVEDHWAFMDRYADEMIARGPTLTADGEEATGSMHIVDLPDEDAAHVFAFDEPNYKAGVYDEVLVRRWSNTLGRTMWEFTGSTEGYSRFLIIAYGAAPDAREHLDQDRLIAYGPLLSDDGDQRRGIAIIAELPDRAAAEALLAQAGPYERVEIHDWEFGGRR